MKVSGEMLAEERRGRILELLAIEGRVKTQRLIGLLKVSQDTIRRDLSDMADQGLLRRVHGGAMPVAHTPLDAPWPVRDGDGDIEKQALVWAFVTTLRGGEVLFIDSGTTNALLARHLPRDARFTVVTPSPHVAVALADHPGCELLMAGGRVHPRTASVCGPEAVHLIGSVRADICVLGVCAVDAASGVTCAEFDELATKQAMVQGAERTVALVTAGKLGGRLPYRVGETSLLAELVTTADPENAALIALRETGVGVTMAAVS